MFNICSAAIHFISGLPKVILSIVSCLDISCMLASKPSWLDMFFAKANFLPLLLKNSKNIASEGVCLLYSVGPEVLLVVINLPVPSYLAISVGLRFFLSTLANIFWLDNLSIATKSDIGKPFNIAFLFFIK